MIIVPKLVVLIVALMSLFQKIKAIALFLEEPKTRKPGSCMEEPIRLSAMEGEGYLEFTLGCLPQVLKHLNFRGGPTLVMHTRQDISDIFL